MHMKSSYSAQNSSSFSTRRTRRVSSSFSLLSSTALCPLRLVIPKNTYPPIHLLIRSTPNISNTSDIIWSTKSHKFSLDSYACISACIRAKTMSFFLFQLHSHLPSLAPDYFPFFPLSLFLLITL